MRNQPTNDDLQSAWTAAIEVEGIGGARALARQHLQQLRDARTTWFDKELSLRAAIDAYLSGKEPSND